MIIDLTNQQGAPASFDLLVPVDEINLHDEAIKLTGAVKIEVRLTKSIVQTKLQGEISAAVELECTRCLTPIKDSLEIPFEVIFVTPENFTEAKEAQLNSSDLEISIFEGDRIDLSEVVREQILLAVPSQILCSEDCKGLCQKCGANRNLIDCNCEEKEIDPRWAKLKELK